MTREIYIIGGLQDCASRDVLLARLVAEVSAEVHWEWLVCSPETQYQAPKSATNRILDKIAQRKAARKHPILDQEPIEAHVIKLFDLHPRTEALVHRVWDAPKPVPHDTRTADGLIAWLQSPESNLFPPVDWNTGPIGAALMAILSKLIRNSSFSSDVSGHLWTKEADLLGQSPVDRPGYSPILKEAKKMLDGLAGKLLLTKGNGQGKTPKEWSINTKHLPIIKRCIDGRTFSPLKELTSMAAIVARIEGEGDEYGLDDDIVTERVRGQCRERDSVKSATGR